MPGQADSAPGPSMGLTTMVAEGSRVSGEIGGSSDVRIEGQFEGIISISGIAFISKSGHARANIRAASVAVSGRVDGDVSADQMIELQPTAVVDGNLLAPKILIREGAALQGRVEMASPPQENSGQKNNAGKSKGGKRRSRGDQNDRSGKESPKSESGGEKA